MLRWLEERQQAFCLRQSSVYGTLYSDALTKFKTVANASVIGEIECLADLTHTDLLGRLSEHRKRVISSVVHWG